MVKSSQCRSGLIFNDNFIRNLVLSLSVKEFWKSVNIWRSFDDDDDEVIDISVVSLVSC